MKETSKVALQIASFLTLDVGLIMVLCETDHSGTAIEAMKLHCSFNGVAIIGIGLAILSLLAFAILHFRYNEKTEGEEPSSPDVRTPFIRKIYHPRRPTSPPDAILNLTSAGKKIESRGR